MALIGISGRAGSGKDTAGSMLVNKYGFTRIAFGDYLKWHCKKYHNWNGQKDEAGRKLLQEQGTDIHRTADNDVWVKYAKLDLDMLKVDGITNIVITDMRFPNEFDFVRENGGTTVRINGRKYDMGEAENHPSEIALDNHKFHYTIDNSSSVDELEKKIDYMLDAEISLGRLGYFEN